MPTMIADLNPGHSHDPVNVSSVKDDETILRLGRNHFFQPTPKTSWNCAMQHERHHSDDDNLAQIWRSAQHRRTADIYSWFTHFFERHRQLKSSDPRSQFPQRRATALAWKLLNAIRAVRRTVH